MRTRVVMMTFVAVLVTLSLSVALEDSDASVPDADETVYFFSYDLTFSTCLRYVGNPCLLRHGRTVTVIRYALPFVRMG